MRHLLYLCIIAALLLAACGPDHDDMLRQLNQLAEANRADSLLTDDALRTLVPAGIYGCRSSFAVETLTSKRMVLRNDSCQLVFRKFG